MTQKTIFDYEVQEYTGELVDGNRHGHGTGKWPDGKQYVGQWQNGGRHGQGMVTWPNGQKYTGEWQGDMAIGKAILTKPDGAVFAGEFLDSQRHGIGIQTYANGAAYTGGWRCDQPEGWGVIRTTDGKQVLGRLEINQRHGRSVQFFENGEDDDNHRIYWEEGELIEQSEWFAREQAQVFIEECRRIGIPFDEEGSISNPEKLHVLNELLGNSLWESPKVDGLAMLAMMLVRKKGTLYEGCDEEGELPALLASGQAGIDTFCKAKNLPSEIREWWMLWSDWSQSEERARVELFLSEILVDRIKY